MKLGVQVGLVFDGDPASPPPNGHSPQFSAHVCCGQTAGWMKLVLGMEVGLSPGDFVLDGDPAFLSQKGAEPPSPIFGLFLLWPNGWMHQDATWYVCRPQPRGLCVRWRTSPSPDKGAEPHTKIFGPCLLWPNGWMDQDASWYRGKPRLMRHYVRCGPSYFQKKGHTHSHPIFGPCLLWPNGWMDEDAAWYGSRPRLRPHCTRRGLSSREKGTAAPSFRPMSIVG